MEKGLKKKLYVARDYNKTLCIFEHKPERDEFMMCWKDMKAPSTFEEIEPDRIGIFKNLRWEDEPVCISVTVIDEQEQKGRYQP